MRFFGPECADTIETYLEFGPVDAVEPIDNFVCRASIDIADEAQSDVVVFHIDPSCTRETTAQQ